MRIINIAFIIISAVIFTSCQKGINETDPVTQASNKVKTYTEDVTSLSGHNVITLNVAYDASDRIVSLTSAASAGDRFVFLYSNGGYTMDLYNSNQLSIHEIFYLNSNSLVDSSFQYNDTNDSSTEKYLYNSAKQLTAIKEYDYSQATGSVLYNVENYTYDSNGNVLKITDNNSVKTYDYYTNLSGVSPSFSPYFPVNKNLVKTTVGNVSGDIVTFSHTYTFDSSNRLSTETATGDNGESSIKTYTYY